VVIGAAVLVFVLLKFGTVEKPKSKGDIF
jgi:hypothetical protein